MSLTFEERFKVHAATGMTVHLSSRDARYISAILTQADSQLVEAQRAYRQARTLFTATTIAGIVLLVLSVLI
jgi:5-bromo-4-chloroindolyl phosphate hydrolysis protein